MNLHLENQLLANLKYISNFNSELSSSLSAAAQSITLISSPLSEKDRGVLIDGQLYSESVCSEISHSVETQYHNVKRVLLQRPFIKARPILPSELSASLVGSEDLLTIGQLETICDENQAIFNLPAHKIRERRTFNNSLRTKNSIFLGSLLLIEWKRLVLPGIETTLVVESDIRQLAVSLYFFNLPELVEYCGNNQIKFDLLFNENYGSDLSARAAVIQHYSYNYPLSYQALTIYNSPILSPSLTVLSSWLTSPDGLSEYVKGYLGNDTDEFNQLLHAFYTASLSDLSIKSIGVDRQPIDNPVIVVGSGPSLDAELTALKRVSSSSNIVAAGSSIGALLRAGIKPKAAVVLEMSSIVYRDLLELASEGYDLSEIPLIASVTVDPRIHNLFSQSIIFQRPLSTSLCIFPGEQGSTLPQAGPQALNAAIEVVLKLGFRKILLVGADLGALDPEYQRSRLAMGKSPRLLNLPVAGRYGQTIMSSAELSVTKQLIENIINLYQATVVSVGEGSQIDNVKHMRSHSDIYDQFLDNSFSFKDLWDTLPSLCTSNQERLELISSASSQLTRSIQELTSLLQASDCWNHDLTQYANKFLSFSSLGSTTDEVSLQLIKRQLRFTLFFVLQPVQEDPLDPKVTWEQRKQKLIKTLHYIEKVYKNYYSLLLSIANFKSVPPWDPEWIRQKLRGLT